MAIDREAVLQAAQKYVEKKKYDRAVLEYQKIIQVDPNDARTLLKIGDLQLKMEAYAEAIATYERVGKFYASQGFALKAIAVYKQIKDIIHRHIPQLEERYGHIAPKLAELYQQLGLTSDALAALDEVATRLQRQNRDNEALAVFRKIVELDPQNPLPHLRLAEALSRAKDDDGAANEFATAATQLLKHGRRDDALKVIERLLHHRQDLAQARIAAEIYLARGGPNDGMQALAKLQVCFQANPKDLDTLALLARSFQAIGQASKGIEVHKEMARIAREQGKIDLFRELVQRLERMAPHDEQVRQLAQAALPLTVTSVSQAEEEVIESADDLIEASVPPPPHPRESDAPEMTIGEESYDDPAALAAQVREILDDAASLRHRRALPRAIETLRLGLEVDPRSLEVRVALRDLLLESGRTDEAVEEMMAMASLQLDALDGEGAARSLQDVLSLDPANQRALHALGELGYDVEPPLEATHAEAPAFETTDDENALAGSAPEGSPVHDDPLPAYDFEDSGESRQLAPRTNAHPAALHPHPEFAPPPPPPPGASARTEHSVTSREPSPSFAEDFHDDFAPQLHVVDDPFGAEGPLPSFPLEAPESDAAFDLVHAHDDRVDEEEDAAASPPRHAPSQRAWPTVELEDALEEAEFFASRGLYDDARAVLNEQLARAPNHPLLRERMGELDAQEQAAAQTSGTRAMPRFGAEADRSFDIATSLDALESLDARAAAPMAQATETSVDVEEVFAKFKEGVKQQIAPDDAQMHYDLGIAYREIGKLDDAIREFEVAARDPRRACVCESMVGLIQMDRGNVMDAIDAFLRGLHAPVRTSEQETVLSFELGIAYEAKKMWKDALGYYQRVARREPNYRDVQERMRRLAGTPSVSPPKARAAGADDEFDRAFDDIIGSGKLP